MNIWEVEIRPYARRAKRGVPRGYVSEGATTQTARYRLPLKGLADFALCLCQIFLTYSTSTLRKIWLWLAAKSAQPNVRFTMVRTPNVKPGTFPNRVPSSSLPLPDAGNPPISLLNGTGCPQCRDWARAATTRLGTHSITFLAFAVFLIQPICAGFFPNDPFTDNARGTTAASFLKLNPSARSSALADTLTDRNHDFTAGFSNPTAFAGLAEKQSLSFTSALLPEEIIEASLAYGRPAGNGKIIFATHELIQPSIALYDSLGNKTGDFSPLDAALHAGYAVKSESGIPLGVNLVYIYTNIGPNLSGWSTAVNFGFGFPPGFFADQNLGLAFSVANLGLPMKIKDSTFPLPFRFQTELAYHLSREALLNLDIFLPVDQVPYVGAGFEWKIPFVSGVANQDSSSGAAVRFGITNKNKTESITNKISFGLGIYLSRFTLDLAMASFGNLGFYPKLGFSWNW